MKLTLMYVVNKLIHVCLVLSVSLLFVLGFDLPIAHGQSNEAKIGMALVENIVASLKDGHSLSQMSHDEQERLIADIQHAFSVVQTENAQITNDNAKDILKCLKVISSSSVRNRADVEATVQRTVLYCLPFVDKLDIDTAGRLVAYLQISPRKNIDKSDDESVNKEWQELRNQFVRSRLELWKKINDTYDPNFDMTNPPSTKVAPPAGVSGIAGMSPESIEDPQMRAQYEAAIKANEEKSKYYTAQYVAREMQRMYPRQLMRSVVYAYSMQPVASEDIDVLQGYLNTYVGDVEFRQDLLQAAKGAAKVR